MAKKSKSRKPDAQGPGDVVICNQAGYCKSPIVCSAEGTCALKVAGVYPGASKPGQPSGAPTGSVTGPSGY